MSKKSWADEIPARCKKLDAIRVGAWNDRCLYPDKPQTSTEWLLKLVEAQHEALKRLTEVADRWHNPQICGCDPHDQNWCKFFKALLNAYSVIDLEGYEQGGDTDAD